MRTRLRAVAVDDEPLGLRRIVRLLTETGRVEVVATAGNAAEALAFPRWSEVDVAFLDINMPGMTGIELARRLPGDPLVVFVTGDLGHTMQALRVNGVDCLHKPVGHDDLEDMLIRLEARVADPARQGARVIGDRVARYLQTGTGRGATGPIEHVEGRMGHSVTSVDFGTITHFASDDRLVYAMTTTKEPHVVDSSLDELERRLDPALWVRIHAKCIVSLAHSELIGGRFWRPPVVRLKDGTKFEVAPERVRSLKERFSQHWRRLEIGRV
jgi:two-component system LytT family response regulator